MTTAPSDPGQPLARVYPFRGSPRIEARFMGGKQEIPETYKSINGILVARAESLGFREVERSRHNFARILGGLTETLLESDHLLSEETLALRHPSWVSRARKEAAARYRTEAIRDSRLESGNFRRATFFARKGEGPVAAVSWLRSAGVDTLLGSIVRHARLAAAFDLEMSWAAPFCCSESHWIAIELSKPGHSILDGWRFGDATYCGYAEHLGSGGRYPMSTNRTPSS